MVLILACSKNFETFRRAIWQQYESVTTPVRHVRLRRDDKALYIAYDRGPIIDKRGQRHAWKLRYTDRDAPVWEDDSVAVFIRDVKSREWMKCIQLGVSGTGAMYDGLWDHQILKRLEQGKKKKKSTQQTDFAADLSDVGIDPDLGNDDPLGKEFLYADAGEWDGVWSGAAKVAPDSFAVELAVPWDTLRSAGLRPDKIAVHIVWRGTLTGSPLEIARQVLLGEQFMPLASVSLDVDPKPWMVRLHFAELEDAAPGDRVFDVRVQDKVVLRDFDITAAAGGVRKAIVKDIPDVFAGASLTVELVSRKGTSSDKSLPIISGMEIKRQ